MVIAIGGKAIAAYAGGIAIAANVALAAGYAYTGYSTYQGRVEAGKAEERRRKYQAEVAANNAKVAEYNAQDALERGSKLEKQHRLKMSKLQGKQRSVLAAQGIELESGSALDLLDDTAYYGELDALTIRNNAKRDAWKYKVNAQNQAAQSGLLQMQGRDARDAANMNATSGALASTTSTLVTMGSSYTTNFGIVNTVT